MEQAATDSMHAAAPEHSGKKVRRAIFPVLDRTFQVKVTLFILLLILLSHLLLLALHYQNLTRSTSGMVGMAPAQMEVYIKKQQSAWTRDLVLGVVAIGIMVGMVVFYLTQRISGPLYAISRILDDAAKGDLKARVHLRRADELLWFADKINETLEAVAQQQKSIVQQLRDGKSSQAVIEDIESRLR